MRIAFVWASLYTERIADGIGQRDCGGKLLFMRFSLLLCLGVFVPVFTTIAAVKPEWPQFRGPGGAAVSESASPPVEFNVSKNLLWKAPISLGYSSPIVAGERVF